MDDGDSGTSAKVEGRTAETASSSAPTGGSASEGNGSAWCTLTQQSAALVDPSNDGRARSSRTGSLRMKRKLYLLNMGVYYVFFATATYYVHLPLHFVSSLPPNM
jgi:hypothetical protein